MRHLLIGSMLVGLMLAGCQAYEDVGGSVTVLQKDIGGENGLTMNGFNSNGLRVNGFALNGYNLNGKYGNGRNANGYYINGSYANGAWQNGRMVNGAWQNGVKVNGLKLNGLNLNGVNYNGQFPNGKYANGGYLNGQWVNGQWVNGFALNGAYINGQYANGYNMNGAYFNGINANGAFMNGQWVNGQYYNGLSLNGLGEDASDNAMKYLTRCAWPATSTLSVTVNDKVYSWQGALNLAPNFGTETEMTAIERQRVTACIEAFTNATGEHVLISVREKDDGSYSEAAYSQLAADAGELSTFKYVENWYFGDNFNEEGATEYLSNVKGYMRYDNGRSCAAASGTPMDPYTKCGFRSNGSSCDANGNCTNLDEPGKVYKGIVTYQQLEPFWTGYCDPNGIRVPCGFVTEGPGTGYLYSHYYDCNGNRNTYRCP